MIAIIEKGVLGNRDGDPIYSIVIDDETDTEVNFMTQMQIDGTLSDLEEEFDFNPDLIKALERLPIYGSLEVQIKLELDIVR
jgi:hypothetical protein